MAVCGTKTIWVLHAHLSAKGVNSTTQLCVVPVTELLTSGKSHWLPAEKENPVSYKMEDSEEIAGPLNWVHFCTGIIIIPVLLFLLELTEANISLSLEGRPG